MGARFKKVAVLKGGFSSERKVSLRSGAAIAEGLREGGYLVEEIDVQQAEFQLSADVEAAFIALHGAFGEDGGVQRALTEMKIPYTGSNIESSRISFDKVLTRNCLIQAGVPMPRGEVLQHVNDRTIPFPVVVKPPREGSSVGCGLVFELHEWNSAFVEAQKYSEEVLVEAYIPGRELTVGVVDGQVLPVVEICADAVWYDYKAKYESGDTEYVVPAKLDDAMTHRLQEIALQTFDALGAAGFGRVDFRLSPEMEPYVLELNNIPGFTASSLLPKAAAAAGIGFSALCCRIMETAHL